ncbi:MAG: lamin tail domain-containing protein [Sedimentisphaerales bacterium]|nr:lamin tail domain-containing protein [Sedimentisphaerales bacterium]
MRAVILAVLWFCVVSFVATPSGVPLYAVTGALQAVEPTIVINELHTNPDVSTELVEYIELHNWGRSTVDVSGWSFTSGVFYTFAAGTVMPPGGYLVVAENPGQLLGKWATLRAELAEAVVLGPYAGKLNNEGERVTLCDAAGHVIDEVDYQLGFPWPTVGDEVPEGHPGTGYSMQLINPRLDNDLGGAWRSSAPTPAKANSAVLRDTAAPFVRQVEHLPRQPKSSDVVTITAKVTDADGVDLVKLSYQPVPPGGYIARRDSVYEALWFNLDMHDDGLDGDAVAGDDVYSVQMPADVQVNRMLVRYRLFVVDGAGDYREAPYADDPQPNFAYFVYDGVPSWHGAIRPGAQGAMGQVVEYGPEVMQSLPVYHLLSKKGDVEACTWREQYGGSDYKWQGTLVYDGEVYDHIRYRARGGVWRYAMGKNMWKFDFNRGHSFQARDDYGRPYDTKWDKINFSACIQQGNYLHRGEQGMFEAAAFKLFNLMGCEASNTSWVHFRIIDEADEFGPTQYDGDFWGLYMNLEQMDGRFLDEHGLPDGNLYKIEGYSGELNNQGPTGATDRSDLNQFMNGYRSRPQEQWWRDNVNLDGYFGYRCVVEGVHHGDIGYGKNWFFYLNPETNKWSMLPWDVDLTWANNMYGNGEDDFKSSGAIFSRPNINIEYQNRLREFHDLLYNADQAYQMLDDLADIIDPPGPGPSFVDADRAMWDYNPIMSSGYINSSKAGQGRFYQQAPTRDFRGMVQIMKDYIVSNNRAFDTYSEDPAAPQTPTVTPTGPEGYPANALTFTTTSFSDPQGAGTFAAMKWRIAEVRPGSQAIEPSPGGASGYVFVPEGSPWRYFKGLSEPSAPGVWRQRSFNDSAWLTGVAPIGYGESFIATTLGDMRYAYTSIYLRKTFNATGLNAFDRLLLTLKYDDGVDVWINGTLVFQDNVPGTELPYDATAVSAIEMFDSVQYDLGAPADLLVDGTNVIAIQVLNADLFSSSDCFVEASLTAERSADSGDDEPTAPAPVYRGTPGKYEIEAAWQSDDLTTFDADVKIPASVVRPGRTYRVRCRMKDTSGRWSHWSAPVQFEAGEPIAVGVLADLRVTELMYNPADPPAGDIAGDEFEFIELKNTGDETLDLTSVSIVNGVTFDFAGSAVTTLGPGQFVLVVRNEPAFLSRYGMGLASRIAGQYSGKLANEGETVSIVDFWNGTVAKFTYGDGRGWPIAADGAGHSLVPLASAVGTEPSGSLDYAGNWRASAFISGSPGQDDPDLAATAVLNELFASGGIGDWIELYNLTASSIDLAGWYLSDDMGDLAKCAIGAATIPAQGYLSFDQGTGLAFGLSSAGEQLFLSHLPGGGGDRVVDAVTFKAQEDDISLGRYPDGAPYWFRLAPSRGAANADPLADVVIDEIMYHAVDPNDEYIELYNPTAIPATLASADGAWRLAGGAEYVLPAGATILAGGRLVLVGFDPQIETARLSAFVAAYESGSLSAGVTILGPWQGNLANGGERLALEKPQATGDINDPVAWVVVDEVIYADVAPWPTTPDGQGDALQRLSADPTQSGNDPANWQAAPASPGLAP